MRPVVILHDAVGSGAAPDAADVLDQAALFERALDALGYASVRMEFTLDLARAAQELTALAPPCVVNLAESVGGHGRLIHLAPSLLDTLGIPYTGAPAEAVFVTSGKPLAKRVMGLAGIPTPRYVTRGPEPGARWFSPGLYVVKSEWEHASLGMGPDCLAEAQDMSDIEARFSALAPAMGGSCFAERYVPGREFNLSVIANPAGGPQVLPPAEMTFADGQAPRILDYAAKWDTGSAAYQDTNRRFDLPPEDAELVRRLVETARQCWSVFGLDGAARVDFRVDRRGRPWVLEVNANPCLAPDAGFMAAATRAGMTETDVVARLLSRAGLSVPARGENLPPRKHNGFSAASGLAG